MALGHEGARGPGIGKVAVQRWDQSTEYGVRRDGRDVASPRPSWLGGQGEALPLPAGGAREIGQHAVLPLPDTGLRGVGWWVGWGDANYCVDGSLFGRVDGLGGGVVAGFG